MSFIERTTAYKSVIILDSTDSTNKDNGSLIVDGGVGVEKNISLGGNINMLNGATVDGVDVSDLENRVTNIESNGILSLTAAEIDQLENIDSVTISNTQWGYLGNLDQPLTTTDTPTFGGIDIQGQTKFIANHTSGDGTDGLVVYENTNTTDSEGTALTVVANSNSITMAIINTDVTSKPIFDITGPFSTGNNSGKCFSFRQDGQGFNAGMFYTDGKYGIGDGTATRDIFISRESSNLLRVSNINGSNNPTTGNLKVYGYIEGERLDIDNIEIDGNTISSTNSNGNISITPNGNGQINLKNAGTYIDNGRGIIILGNNPSGVSGSDDNTAIGINCMNSLIGGDENVVIGTNAGNTGTEFDNCVVIGYNSDINAVSAINRIVIGSGAIGTVDNSVQIGNSSITDLRLADLQVIEISGTNDTIFGDVGGEAQVRSDPISSFGIATKQYVDNHNPGNLTNAEVQQLENINSVTISNTQWSYLGNLDQNLSTTDNVTFNQISSSTYVGLPVASTTVPGIVELADATNVSNRDTNVALTPNLVPLNNYNDTNDPTDTDGANDGYEEGSQWINTTSDEGFICLDPSNGGNAVWKQITNYVYGSFFDYIQEDTTFTTSSTTNVTVTSLTTASIPAGTYEVSWYVEYGISSTTDIARFDITVDGTEIADRNTAVRSGTITIIQKAWSGFQMQVFSTAATHTINLETNISNPGEVLTIERRTLKILRVS